MSASALLKRQDLIPAIALAGAVLLLYAGVLKKLGFDWWSDENYSHGLLIPIVIGIILWLDRDAIRAAVRKPAPMAGIAATVAALLLLLAGTLGAELFTTRISLVLLIAGCILYLFGSRLIWLLAVPFALLVLSIPIPQIIFNRIAFPLQIWASQIAVWGIRLFDVPALRKGNVIEILPRGGIETISLEVVEACSGIRSLMTLVTLALILVYFTRSDGPRLGFANMPARDLIRAGALMMAAIPVAVLTNAARVAAIGYMTHTQGRQATGGFWHDASGWMVFIVALGLLLGLNVILKHSLGRRGAGSKAAGIGENPMPRSGRVWPLVAIVLIGGVTINWLDFRGEAVVERRQLAELPARLGEWNLKGGEIRFDPQIEAVLGTTDYTMREYRSPHGRVANIYVGYYASQRSGATYHSPQNCLPGSGWVLKDPQHIRIATADGRTFPANRYVIENGIFREVMIYWYQGRGRFEASEYRDKFNTVWDSMTRGRTDGAIVRIMTGAGSDDEAAYAAALDLAAGVADALPPFIPE
jgi:exosortase D (VPLPA-CTERM-specific)